MAKVFTKKQLETSTDNAPDFKLVNPVLFPRWNQLILNSPDHTVFHTTQWARVLSETYYYLPYYFLFGPERDRQLLLPLMAVKSILTPLRGVSLPFTDYCEPVCPGEVALADVFHPLISVAKKSGWRYIELRGDSSFDAAIKPFAQYYRHSLNLSAGTETLFAGMRSNYRSKLRKAEKHGIEVRLLRTPEALHEYYRLHCRTRKRQGLPPQPFKFFRNIYQYIVKKGLGSIVLATHRDKPVAGAVFFHSGRRVIYKFGASDEAHRNLQASYPVMWHAIRWAAENGYEAFCFGRTDRGQSGLIQFKEGWGAVAEPLHYFRYDLKKERFIEGPERTNAPGYSIFKKLPLPVLKLAGEVVYRHVG